MPRKVHVDELLLPINTSLRALMAKSNKKKTEDFFLALRSPLCINRFLLQNDDVIAQFGWVEIKSSLDQNY